MYSTTLPVAEVDDLAHESPVFTSIACPKNAAVLNESYSCGASSKGLGSNWALVDPGTYIIMIPLDLQDDQGCAVVPLKKPSPDRP